MRVSASLAARLFLLCFVVSSSATCGNKTPLAPFIDVTVTNVPASATQLQVTATFSGNTQTELGSNTTLNRFTISLPNDARGQLALQATLRDAQNCIVATGQLSQDLVENQVYQLTLALTAQTPPLCPGGAMVPITLLKTGFGGGNIVANPPSLSCDNLCTTKSVELEPGTVVSLNVDGLASGSGWTASFDGWSGACSGTTTCFVTLAQASTVTARFSCHGWCPENSPTETKNLNAIWAFSPQRIVAVGDEGSILQWDSSSWKRINSPVPTTLNLRSVHGVSGGIGFAVGDMGTIIKTTDSGTTWTTMASGTSANLRGVWANDSTTVYAVGDNIMTGNPWLSSDGTTWGRVTRSGVDYPWNAIWGYATVDYFVVGEMGRSVIGNPFNIPTAVNANQLNGIYGTSRDTMTAVGLGSTILRLNNTTWTMMSPPTGTGYVILRGIHGTPTNDMYAVGDSGTVWFNSAGGSLWTVESFPVSSRLNAVHVMSTNEVYVVGAGGLIYHKKQ